MDNFRDHINTMDQTGVRKWIYPKKINGKYYKKRTYLSWILIVFFILSPFITINNNPFFKFDILRREFFIFSFPFYPQDFFLFALSTIIILIFIYFFTVIYGRIFCGWLCPQTIFLEMIFRKVEYLIEGNRGDQIYLDKQSWNIKKILKKSLKWSIFLLISFSISHILFAYFIGYDTLLKAIKEGPIKNKGIFLIIFLNTCAIYFIYSWFREQVCTLVCPYGRLQSVLINKDTIVVAYDYKRGESIIGRSKFKKGENRKDLGKGDCIDCGQCVSVCPTGIDIRNGTQLECINCTACIDACDEIMDKVNLPRGLIRYASEDNITTSKKTYITKKMLIYTFILIFLTGILSMLLIFRNPVEAKLLRVPGYKFTIKLGQIINPYEYTLINKTSNTLNLYFKILSHRGKITSFYNKKYFKIKKGEITKGLIYVTIPNSEILQSKNQIKIGIYNDKKILITIYTTYFLGPFKF